MEVITVLTGGAGFEDAAEYLPYVSALRRDRIARKRSGSDKLLSLTAGLLISLEVTRRTGIPRGSIRYVHGAFGKEQPISQFFSVVTVRSLSHWSLPARQRHTFLYFSNTPN